MSEAPAPVREPDDIRPVVATGNPSNLGLWAFLVLLAIGGAWIFSALNTNRMAMKAPATSAPKSTQATRISAAPPLSLPPDYLDQTRLATRSDNLPSPREPLRPAATRPPPRVVVRPVSPPANLGNNPAASSGRLALPRPAIAFERKPDRRTAQSTPLDKRDGPDRVEAGRLANPGYTVPRGTIIPAVLETALDSTRPGAARALVQRDIHSFDGSRVLIPRGSRLYGEYAADLESGQKRAAIKWTRLLRPDGVTIELDSPASDPLGRAGVKGKVHSKFFQRFGGAILQSVLDIGVGVATREATDGVIVALPGSTQNVARAAGPTDIRPTLTVKHGTSVSVFVARDLDFWAVDR